MEEKIQNIIANKINPQLALHGGACELIDVTDDGIVTIRLMGGCAGCPSRNMTLLSGITPVLKEQIPEIKQVVLG